MDNSFVLQMTIMSGGVTLTLLVLLLLLGVWRFLIKPTIIAFSITRCISKAMKLNKHPLAFPTKCKLLSSYFMPVDCHKTTRISGHYWEWRGVGNWDICKKSIEPDAK